MSEICELIPIRSLIEGCWPGEWGSDPLGDDGNCVVFRATDIDSDGHLNIGGGASRHVLPSKLKAKLLRRGDILLEASGGAPDKPVGRVALVDQPPQRLSLTSNFFRFIRPVESIDAHFLLFQLVALNRSSAIWRYQQQTTGLINLKVEDYLGHRVWCPSKARQVKIADILTSIDSAIKKTGALIAKCQQIKAGLMHDLFTRGMLPNGQLRPPREQAPELYQETAIGWIPRGWSVAAIEKVLTKIIDYRGKTPEKTVSGIPLITAKNVRMGYIDPEPREFIAESAYANWMTRGIPNKGDVLFTTEAPLGNVAQVPSDDRVAFAQRAIILQPSEVIEATFLAYRLMTETTQNAISRLASGSTALGIKQSEFRKVCIAFPNAIAEQREIARRLHAIDNLIDAQRNAQNKLHSKKSGLMHDLLTGKVPVTIENKTTTTEAVA